MTISFLSTVFTQIENRFHIPFTVSCFFCFASNTLPHSSTTYLERLTTIQTTSLYILCLSALVILHQKVWKWWKVVQATHRHPSSCGFILHRRWEIENRDPPKKVAKPPLHAIPKNSPHAPLCVNVVTFSAKSLHPIPALEELTFHRCYLICISLMSLEVSKIRTEPNLLRL